MRTHIGQLLMGTGALHTLLGVLGFRRFLVDIHRGRYLNTIGRDPERNAALWCLTTGALLIVLGRLARSTQERTGEMPRSLGWGLLAISVPGWCCCRRRVSGSSWDRRCSCSPRRDASRMRESPPSQAPARGAVGDEAVGNRGITLRESAGRVGDASRQQEKDPGRIQSWVRGGRR